MSAPLAVLLSRLTAGVSRRSAVLLAAALAAFLAAPWIVNDYLLTVLIIILYFAYAGQAWNIMMGFTGQLSLGHAIYVGLGGYVAAVLFTRYGVVPWLGLFAAMPVAAACGAVIGFLAFRFGVTGVYFAILTIAFAEFARIGFDHLDIVNAAAGLFLPVAQYAHNDLWRLRGSPTMFYYVILTATLAVFVLCRFLITSRIGYFWLAIREDEEAARAAGIDTFRYKMYAVTISAAVTSFASSNSIIRSGFRKLWRCCTSGVAWHRCCRKPPASTACSYTATGRRLLICSSAECVPRNLSKPCSSATLPAAVCAVG